MFKRRALFSEPSSPSLRWIDKIMLRYLSCGVMLLTRHCKNQKQLTKFCQSIREVSGLSNFPICIDQEGGMVTRLKPPNWPFVPYACVFGKLAVKNLSLAKELLFDSTLAQVGMLREAGINMIFGPTLDLKFPNTHDFLAFRSLGSDPLIVSELGQVIIDAYVQNGIDPVPKHLPGHGRSDVDSHLQLPFIDADLAELRQTDFVPFYRVRNCRFFMPGHLVIKDISGTDNIVISKKAISFLKQEFGSDLFFVTDDLSMGAVQNKFKYYWQIFKAIEDSGVDISLFSIKIRHIWPALFLSSVVDRLRYDSFKFKEPVYQSVDADFNPIDYWKLQNRVNKELTAAGLDIRIGY